MALRLTIVIATYNRADYIGETIKSILPQLTDEVELLIVDGASTDNTGGVVSELIKTDIRLRYVCLPTKGGVDHDYCKAVELAEGEYCWLFTDDDFFKPGAVREVLAAINENHSLIVVNLDAYDRGMKNLLETPIKLDEDKIYSSETFESFFTDAIWCLTFIGSVVIRRSVWLAREKEKFFGTEFIHVGVIFQKPFTGTIKVISRPLINYRSGMAQWASRGFSIWMFKWPELVWSFAGISSEAKARVCERLPWRSLWTLLIYKSLGMYDLKVYRSHLKNTDATKIWKILALFIAMVPRKMVVMAHYIYSRFRGQASRAFFSASHRGA